MVGGRVAPGTSGHASCSLKRWWLAAVAVVLIYLMSATRAWAIRPGPTASAVATLSVLKRPALTVVDPRVEIMNRRLLQDVDDMDAEKEEDLSGLHRAITAVALSLKEQGNGIDEEEDEFHFIDAAQWVHAWISRQVKHQ